MEACHGIHESIAAVYPDGTRDRRTLCCITRGVERLNDIDYGLWQWKTRAEVQSQWPDLLQCWFSAPHLVRFPNGESLQDLAARIADLLRVLGERHDTLVLVGHSGIRVLLLQALDLPLSAYWRLTHDPAAVTEVELTRDSLRALRINQTPEEETA